MALSNPIFRSAGGGSGGPVNIPIKRILMWIGIAIVLVSSSASRAAASR